MLRLILQRPWRRFDGRGDNGCFNGIDGHGNAAMHASMAMTTLRRPRRQGVLQRHRRTRQCCDACLNGHGDKACFNGIVGRDNAATCASTAATTRRASMAWTDATMLRRVLQRPRRQGVFQRHRQTRQCGYTCFNGRGDASTATATRRASVAWTKAAMLSRVLQR